MHAYRQTTLSCMSTHPLNHSLTHSINQSNKHSITQSITQSLTHSITQSLTHPPTHSPTHPRSLWLGLSHVGHRVHVQRSDHSFAILVRMMVRESRNGMYQCFTCNGSYSRATYSYIAMIDWIELYCSIPNVGISILNKCLIIMIISIPKPLHISKKSNTRRKY